MKSRIKSGSDNLLDIEIELDPGESDEVLARKGLTKTDLRNLPIFILEDLLVSRGINDFMFARLEMDKSNEGEPSTLRATIYKTPRIYPGNWKSKKVAATQSQIETENLALDSVLSEFKIEKLPPSLIKMQLEKMREEIKLEAMRMGLVLDEYLARLGKKESDMEKDLSAQAERMTKIGLAVRAIAREENVGVDEEEIEEELKSLREKFDQEEVATDFESPSFREYTGNILLNRKVVKLIIDTIVEKQPS